MAAPHYVTASTGSTDATGAWAHTAAVAAVGDTLLVQVLQDGTAADAAIDSVTNAEDLAGTDNTLTKIGEFAVGSGPNASQHLWIGRATSTSAMVITGSNAGGDDVYVRVYNFRNVNTGTAITDVIENGTAGSTANSAGSGTTVSDAGVTTLGVDRLALNLVSANDDIAIDAFAGATGGTWTELVAEYVDAGGTDGMVQLQAALLGISSSITMLALASVFGGSGTNEAKAQSFASGAGGTVSRVILGVSKTGSPTDNLVVEIQTDSGGVPSGTVVGSSASIAGADISTAVQLLGFSVSATLSASTTYWVVLTRSGSRDTSNYFSWAGGTGLYPDGLNAGKASGSWSAGSIQDHTFSVQYAPTGSTIDGGTDTVVSAAWGACGFALIGTTVEAGGNTYEKAGYGKESG